MSTSYSNVKHSGKKRRKESDLQGLRGDRENRIKQGQNWVSKTALEGALMGHYGICYL